MKILHITPDFNFAVNFVKPVCLEQVKLNNSVTVITTNTFYSTGSKQPDTTNDSSAEFTPVRLILLNLRLRNLKFSLVTSYLRYLRFIIRENFDIIVFHTTLDSTFPLIIAKLFTRGEKVYFNHGVPSLGYEGSVKGILNTIEKLNIRLSDRIFTVGKGMSRALQDIDRKASPQYISPGSACGINLITKEFADLVKMRAATKKTFNLSSNDRIVIYVGRPVKRKGIFDLIEAWRMLEKPESYKLLLVGPKKEDFAAMDLESYQIRATGYIKDVLPYYLIADVLCVPSYHEGLGYTYLEAASAGCVPVSSDIPGPTDFVDSEVSGLTVTPGNADEITAALEMLLRNEPYRLKLSENAFNKVLEYDRQVIAKQVARKLVDRQPHYG